MEEKSKAKDPLSKDNYRPKDKPIDFSQLKVIAKAIQEEEGKEDEQG